MTLIPVLVAAAVSPVVSAILLIAALLVLIALPVLAIAVVLMDRRLYLFVIVVARLLLTTSIVVLPIRALASIDAAPSLAASAITLVLVSPILRARVPVLIGVPGVGSRLVRLSVFLICLFAPLLGAGCEGKGHDPGQCCEG